MACFRPLFVLSLPRSGSTLLQRVLAAHSDVATTSEPWLLLPLLYAHRTEGVHGEYGHALAASAISEFIEGLPGGRSEFDGHLRRFVLGLYRSAAGNGATYFLDKSPRYCLVAEEIVELFPDGRFVFLWRHPLAVLASIVETFHAGRWRLHPQKALLFDGLPALIRAAEKHPERIVTLRYEDLVTEPVEQLDRLLDYLELGRQPGLLESFSQVELRGRMRDHAGTTRYARISREPLGKWKTVFRNPLRKAWARSYLQFVGRDRLAFMGYDLDALIRELDALPPGGRDLLSDLCCVAEGLVYSAFDGPSLKRKFAGERPWRRVYGHF